MPPWEKYQSAPPQESPPAGPWTRYASAPPTEQPKTGVTDRLRQGMADFGIGFQQVATDLQQKAQENLPEWMSNALTYEIGKGVPTREELARRKDIQQQAARDLRAEEGDVGFGGGLVQALANPLTYVAGPLKFAAPLSAGASTLLRAETEDKGLGDRATDAAINAAIARVVAPLADAGIRKATDTVKSGLSVVLSPIDAAKRVTSPLTQRVLDMDNPVTGGEGLKRAMQSEYAREGARLEQKLGTPFTVAEKTGNQRAVAIEDYLANSPSTAEQVFANARTRIDDLSGRFEEKLAGISPQSSSAATIGADISRSYDDLTTRIRNARRVQADFDFSKANRLAKDAPVVTPTNAVATLQKFIDEANSELATPAQREAGRQAETMLKRLTVQEERVTGTPTNKIFEGQAIAPGVREFAGMRAEVINQAAPKPLTIRDLQNGLSTYTEAGKATGGIWKDIGTAQDRRFANEMKSALMKDMDEAIAQSGDDTIRPALDALATARDRYKDFSGRLEKVRDTVLGKYLGSAEARTPERVAEQLRAMRPTEIEATLKVLDRASPETALATRRYYLEQALSAATSGKGQTQTGLRTAGTLDVKDLLKSLPSDEQMNAIFRGQPQLASVREDLTDIVSALNRIVTYGGTKGGSPTMTRAETGGMLRAPVQFVKRMALDATLPANIADLMLNPGQRQAAAKAARAGDYGTLAKLLGNTAGRTVVPAAANANNDNVTPGGEATGSASNLRERGVGGASSSPAIQPGRSILPSPQSAAPFGLRPDGTPKGSGFLGVLRRPDGDISTEISIGVNIGGKEVEIPTLVPTLSKPEIDHLLNGGEPTEAIIQKAVTHAKQRIEQGKSPFAQPEEGPQSNASPLMQRMAQAESGGDPSARSPKGTASGLFQFTDDTWAQSVAKWGKELGVTLKDKNQPEAQRAMAEKLAADNARILGRKLGRPVTDGEVYAAHFLGASDAEKLIKAQGTGKQAILLFSRRVTNDNRPIFFDGKRPRSVEEVMGVLNNKVS